MKCRNDELEVEIGACSACFGADADANDEVMGCSAGARLWRGNARLERRHVAVIFRYLPLLTSSICSSLSVESRARDGWKEAS